MHLDEEEREMMLKLIDEANPKIGSALFFLREKLHQYRPLRE